MPKTAPERTEEKTAKTEKKAADTAKSAAKSTRPNTKATAPKKSAAASSKTSKTTKKAPAKKLRKQAANEIFALDIGTRNVIGVLGSIVDGVFSVTAYSEYAHTQRAMIDGQIEDIAEVARVVKLVKNKLEEKTGIALSKVAIAAAGRALRTQRTELEFDIDDKEAITEEAVKSFEVETVFKAQNELDEKMKNGSLVFYCVGHTVVNYFLDDYKIKNLIGHKGKKVKVELIAAFLPNVVVESLYSVMDMNKLEVTSLTLEPIAAMNVIIPPEVRLINIALVDIGAGTSDIAISQNGSIVAYAMSTIAGDEITEEVIRSYIVDFETAEKMKISASKNDTIKYTDILGFEKTVTAEEFFRSLEPAVGSLASNISESIVNANGGQSPAAVFLVGGGSLIPNLSAAVAEKLSIPKERVAVGGKNAYKNIDLGRTGIGGPEYVTPIGIGVTAVVNKGYDFSVVTLNGKKMRIFDTRSVSIADMLVMAGFKTNQIIGRSGRSLTFTLNGERQLMKGTFAVPGQITLNGLPVSLDQTVKQGDVIEFVPAESGIDANVNISDIAGELSDKTVMVDGVKYTIGITATVNGKPVGKDYDIQNNDKVIINETDTLGDLMGLLPFDAEAVGFFKGGKQLGFDYILRADDDIITGDKIITDSAREGRIAKAVAERSEVKIDYSVPVDAPIQSEPEKPATTEQNGNFYVVLNGKSVILPPRPNDAPHEFIELMSIADIDLDNPPPSGDMITTVNGKNASFMDRINDGDIVVIRWADK